MKFQKAFIYCLILLPLQLLAQPEALTIDTIMQDPASWMGSSPHNPWWSDDSKTLYFYWNPDKNFTDSVYGYNISTKKITKSQKQPVQYRSSPYMDSKIAARLYLKEGDIFDHEQNNNELSILSNIKGISNIYSGPEGAVYFSIEQNLYRLNRKNGSLAQLTNFSKGTEKVNDKTLSTQDAWLERDQLAYFKILQKRFQESELQKKNSTAKEKKKFYTGAASIDNLVINPTSNFISFRLIHEQPTTRTIVPNFVTQSGYTTDLNARPKVGHNVENTQLGIYILNSDSVYYPSFSELPGLRKTPEFAALYPGKKYVRDSSVMVHGPWYSNEYPTRPLFEVRSMDNKDRWLALFNLSTGTWKVLDHQRDEAWIGGPGIGWLYQAGDLGWMPDGKSIWFQSEADGFSHLYTYNVETDKKSQLTSGNYEVYEPKLSKNGKAWFFHANIGNAGERHFYTMELNGSKPIRLTEGAGGHNVILSEDEKLIADLYSTANHPPELYVSKLKSKGFVTKITNSQTAEWSAKRWMKPEIIKIKAGDGVSVPARLYEPKNNVKNGAAIIFVHGAGYLQNAHTWWSSYFREYMFHNLLASKGFTVLDIDYRGSAGYGRDYRTAIYRHMGGTDLSDQVDGANWLIANKKIDKDKIGIYGGSYGGFITLMALFTEPQVFAAGAALRSVTDWAHYNHPYTSNILNLPTNDSLAYAQSSPIYFAEGLNKPLLICHGMVDTNVHFQDVVRLAQRLIELKKENWELAVYPVEGHGFEDPSSWADEYKRILKLFEEHLK